MTQDAASPSHAPPGRTATSEAGCSICAWCGRPFPARRGGSPQRFCCAGHRIAFWSALRRWGERALAADILTIGDIRNGSPAACTLPPARVSSTAEVTSPESCDEARDLLHALLSVPSDGWHALAAVMSDELFGRLKSWHAVYLAEDHSSARRS